MSVTVDQVLHLAPQASAGEGGTLAPAEMTMDQLMFQARQLLGRDVVYTVRVPDGTHENRAGNLVEYPDGLYIRNTERLSHLRGVRPWIGKAEQFRFPGDFLVQRIIAAHVYQNELLDERDREVDRLVGLCKTLEARVEELQRQVHESDKLIQLQVNHTPGGTALANSMNRAGSHDSHNNTPSMPAHFPTAPVNTPASPESLRRWGNNIPVDLGFMHSTFSDRDRVTCEQWLSLLHNEEIRTVYDLSKLTDHDWDKLALPIIVKRKLIEVSRGAI